MDMWIMLKNLQVGNGQLRLMGWVDSERLYCRTPEKSGCPLWRLAFFTLFLTFSIGTGQMRSEPWSRRMQMGRFNRILPFQPCQATPCTSENT